MENNKDNAAIPVLPDDILSTLFSFLPPTSLNTVLRTNRLFNQLGSDRELQTTILRRIGFFKEDSTTFEEAKHEYTHAKTHSFLLVYNSLPAMQSLQNMHMGLTPSGSCETQMRVCSIDTISEDSLRSPEELQKTFGFMKTRGLPIVFEIKCTCEELQKLIDKKNFSEIAKQACAIRGDFCPFPIGNNAWEPRQKQAKKSGFPAARKSKANFIDTKIEIIYDEHGRKFLFRNLAQATQSQPTKACKS